MQAQISQFYQGLNAQLKFHVQTANPVTLDEAIGIARRYETVYQQNPQQAMHQMMYQPLQATQNTELAETLKGITQQLKEMAKQNQQQKRPDFRRDNRPQYRDNRDWNRNNSRPPWQRDNNNWQRDQRSPPRQFQQRPVVCYSCNEPGHILSNCPNQRAPPPVN
jgi:hypothetical protein